MIEQTLKEVRAKQEEDKYARDIPYDNFDDILKGELSAMRAYEQAREILHQPNHEEINQFHHDHKEAFKFWKKASNRKDFNESSSAGIWGKVVEGFVGTAKIIGDTTTVKALKKGEEHGLRQYEEMLRREDIPIDYKEKIKKVFIPQTQKHINNLEAMANQK